MGMQFTGGFLLGKNHKGTATIATAIGEDPEQDGFAATISKATLSDVVDFWIQMLGGGDPQIPLLDEIVIKNLSMSYTPNGMTTPSHTYPAGFTFDADIDIEMFGSFEIEAYLALNPKLFEIKMTMSPFKIMDLISVSGKDAEEGPLFHLQVASPSNANAKSLIEIDCKITFLFVTVEAVIDIRFPSVFNIDFQYTLLGISTQFNVVSSGVGDNTIFKISFEMGPSQKQKAREQVIKRDQQAAQKMQLQMKEEAQDAKKAEEAYIAALEQLKKTCKDAREAYDKYCNNLVTDCKNEKKNWKGIIAQTKKDVESVKGDLNGNYKALQKQYNTAITSAEYALSNLQVEAANQQVTNRNEKAKMETKLNT